MPTAVPHASPTPPATHAPQGAYAAAAGLAGFAPVMP